MLPRRRCLIKARQKELYPRTGSTLIGTTECSVSAFAVRRGRDDKKWDRKSHRGLKVTTMNVVPCQEVEEVPTSSRHQVESNTLAVILGESWRRSQSRCLYISKANLNQYCFCFNCPGCRATGTILAINHTQEWPARIQRALEETAKEREILQRTVTRRQADKEALVDASHPTSRQREIHGRMRSVRFDAEPGGDRAYGCAKPCETRERHTIMNFGGTEQQCLSTSFSIILTPGLLKGLTSRPVTLVCFYGEARCEE